MRKLSSNVQQANHYLADEWDPKDVRFEDLKKLAVSLRSEREFGHARKLFALILERYSPMIEPKTRIYLGQQQALCTYKDPHLPTGSKLDTALKILEQTDPLRTTQDQETLGLAGAIYKRKWEFEGLIKHLERSVAYYLRGFAQGIKDQGYTGINAAYVLDVIAAQEQTESDEAGTVSEFAMMRQRRADEIRRAIVDGLRKQEATRPDLCGDWWFQVTLGEAHFGLGEYDEAEKRFQTANSFANPPDWEYESTARQLASLSRIRSKPGDTGARRALTALLRNNYAVERSFSGKVGLALSGGGFRAALFHIGVLAKLAELDVLRHVEVLSCVSGGAILGAHYYIKLKRLLEANAGPLGPQDYVRLVEELKDEFLAGVQRNIRVRVATNLAKSLKMVVLPGYSRTHRAGELYERELYGRIKGVKQPRFMDDLLLDRNRFDIKRDNWKRHDKVPMLVLNTTALNTGHTWQFTGSWMGEPPTDINTEIDTNYRLRRMYYEEAPGKYEDVAIGHAVAASACVPGIFSPLEMADLYEDKTVRLVDGGVHDNQGTGSLLEQECTILLVSDASGQMDPEDDPGDGLLSVPLRSNSILQARVREAEYADLASRVRAGLLQGLMFIHLKKGLDAEAIGWIPSDKTTNHVTEKKVEEDPQTPYRVLKQAQEKLAGIRTDLDSFSNIEAHALMASGYLMTDYEFVKSIKNFPTASPPPKTSWNFMVAAGPICDVNDPKHKGYMKVLSVSHLSALKVWLLCKPLTVTGIIALLLGFGALYVYGPAIKPLTLTLSVRAAVIALLGILVTKLFGKTIARTINYRKTLNEAAMAVVFLSIGWILAWLHLGVFDRLYLKLGRE